MRISFIEPHLKIYGGIRRILELSNHLVARGHAVTIFHSDGSPCRWMSTTATIRSYEEVLDRQHEVLIFNDPNPVDFHLAKKAKAALKVLYVLELYQAHLLDGVHTTLLDPRRRRTLYMKAFLESPYLKLANASWLVRWLKDNLGVDARRLIGGVNQEMFHPVEVRRDSTKIRVLCSGDPRPRKGTQIVREAFSIAQAEEPNLILDTYSGQNIPQQRMALKYSSADIFVDAQQQGGWNNPVAEAMACKTPVICTDIGSVQDFAFHEQTALLVPKDDPEHMAAAILRLARNRKLRDKLSENAYQQISQFEWAMSAQKLEGILDCQLEHIRTRGNHARRERSGSTLFNALCLYSSLHWQVARRAKRFPLRRLLRHLRNAIWLI